MKFYQVGSSIHGDLLSPNDIDIAVVCASSEEFELASFIFKAMESSYLNGKSIAVSRQENLNFIILLNISILKYTSSMDVNLVRGYRDLSTGKLYLSNEAKKGLKDKIIRLMDRDKKITQFFQNAYSEDETNEHRYIKYVKKLPKGWLLADERK